MSKLSYIVFLLFLPFANKAQNGPDEKGDGIKWAFGQSWKEIKERAAKEGKYIFIDAMATWCGPCKKMDKETFVDPDVANLINSQFIPVKLQMDKTKNDNEATKSWYADAALIGQQYRVNSYPTYIFISPKGELTHILKGYKDVQQFITETNIALQPGQRYHDPNAEYYIMQEAFNSGLRNYKEMPVLFKKAMELREVEFAREVSKVYRSYLDKQPKRKLYTKENIEFLTAHGISSKSPTFRLFYPDGRKADIVMKIKGFSESIVDKVIMREITEPILGFKTGGMGLMLGKTDSSEANWEAIYDSIATKYNTAYAQRNLLNAKLLWYSRKKNAQKLDETLRLALETYGIDSINSESGRSFLAINGHMWRIFKSSHNPKQLNYAAHWMKKVVESSSQQSYHAIFIDTYANLLYKLGKKEEAISWEEKSIEILKEKGYASYLKQYETVLAKMKAGQPTWSESRK